jgi:hypothetical protein
MKTENILLRLLQIIMVFGVIFLAFNNKEGWGWLLFILVLSL